MRAITTPDAFESNIQQQSVSTLRVLRLEAQMECLRLLRNLSFSVPILLFPVMFYLLFGVMLSARYGSGAAAHLLASFMVFGVVAPGLFGIGVTLAMDRERGLLELKRALPMPSAVYLTAKFAVAVLLAAAISLLLMMLAATIGKVTLAPLQWSKLFVFAVLGVLPFCGMGLLVGAFVKGQAAPAVINLIYLPMAFLSGVLMPLAALPPGIARLAPLWPAYHLAQLTSNVVDSKSISDGLPHVTVLIGIAGLCFAIAHRRLRKRS